jgi:NhaP-type Na+/H+ and K+/H+ antiporter
MDIYYTREQFGKAVYALAIGPGEIRTRLAEAMMAGIIHASTDAASVPAHLQQRINELRDRLTAVPGPNGSIHATIESLTLDECIDAAREIVDLDHLLQD